ncbi:MAG: octaprenyl-diphosphate synthase [Candidatus Binatota bacterium]|nr:octaprenyl-diphosphate synthase [Candidatus Binatota bacterium]
MGVFRACGGDDARDMVDVAVALELIHSATLLHDDIIDGSDYRRGRVSAYRQFGSADTLVAGDFLFSKAFELCGRFEETIVRWAAEACIALTEGEIMQGRFRRNPAVTIADYWEIIDRKTACLFQQGARVAAHLAGASRYRVETLARSGQAIGMTFQVIDDLLDVEGEAATTGKPVGIDIRDGNPSLPILIGMEEDARVAEIWRSEAPTDDEVAEAIERIRASSAPDRVREEARRFMESAARELATLPDTPYRETLEGLVAELEERAL